MSESINKNTFKKTEIALEHIIELLPGHVYWKDLNGKLLGCNKAQAETLGLESINDVIGRDAFSMTPCGISEEEKKIQADKINKIDMDIINTGESQTVEEPLTLPNGEVKHFISHKVPMTDEEGNIVGLVGVSLDITNKKIIEEDLKKEKKLVENASKSKSILISALAYEVMTKLNNIVGKIDLLAAKESLSDEGRESCRVALDECAEIPELFALASDYDNIEQEGLAHSEVFNISRDITHRLQQHREKAINKNITFKVDIDKKIPKIRSNPRRIYDMFDIFVSNAIKHTQQGCVSVRLLQQKIKKQDYIQLIIEDTGYGIEQHRINSFFKYFELDDKERVYLNLGPKMGLCSKIMDSIGGKIDIQSEINKGTTFTLKIPVKFIDDEKHTNSEVRALIIEDNQYAAVILKSFLDTHGIVADIADSGKSANDYIKKFAYDIIFIDISLPDISGINLCKQLKRKYNKLIFGVTAHVESSLEHEAYEAGMDYLLRKPVSLADITHLLAQEDII